MRKFWTKEEMAMVRYLYPNTPTAEIARVLGRKLPGVYGAAKLLGLRKSDAYLASPAACRLRRNGDDHPGRATQFKKGTVPPNKGLRRPGYAPGRMRETQFRKGERRGASARNWCPVGTIKIDSEGYRRIKVREHAPGEHTGFGNTQVWPLLQRHVWEQEKGPVPRGHVVVFKDGDRARCEIDNLECISRAELAIRNQMWTKMPRELAEVIQLNGALKRKLRRVNAEK